MFIWKMAYNFQLNYNYSTLQCNGNYWKLLERVQYNATLAVTGTWRGTNRSKLYEELGWESLNDRRWSRQLIQFYKIRNNLTPQYLRDHLPPVRSSLYGVRHPYNYRNIYCNSSSYQNSFYPNAIRLWNNLDTELHERKSLETFKKCIRSVIKPPQNSLFRIYNPCGTSYELRVGLSPLRSHKNGIISKILTVKLVIVYW